MNGFVHAVFGIFFLCNWIALSAQQDTPEAVWLLPGVDVNIHENLRTRSQAGYNHYLKSALLYPQAFIQLNKNLVLNPAYIYLIRKQTDGQLQQEHYLTNAVIIQARIKKFFLDDRNMIWNRITVDGQDRHYYRNRLRLMQEINTWNLSTHLYCYNEIFLLLNRRNPSRNRAAIGLNSDLFAKLNLDCTYIHQWDRGSGRLNLFFVAAVWRW